jgi:hypothetical protein
MDEVDVRETTTAEAVAHSALSEGVEDLLPDDVIIPPKTNCLSTTPMKIEA